MALITLRHHETGDLMEVHDHHAEAYLGAGWVRLREEGNPAEPARTLPPVSQDMSDVVPEISGDNESN